MNAVLLVLSALFFGIAQASVGDRDVVYVNCVNNCLYRGSCSTPLEVIPREKDFFLWLWGWTCKDDCEYHCMRAITEQAQRRGQPMVQYHGKWPFVRIAGMQEFFSAIFSVGNFIPSAIYFVWLWRDPAAYASPIRPYMMVNMLLGMNAWVWSTWFHARDLVLSEHMDYLMADLFVAYCTVIAWMRGFEISSRRGLVLLHAGFLGGWLIHCYRMETVLFDYGLNTKLGVIVSAMASVGWVFYLRRCRARPYVWKLVVFEVFGWVAALNEVFDYPPFYDVLDAHAVWHGSTVPLAFIIWSFAVDDTIFEAEALQKKKL